MSRLAGYCGIAATLMCLAAVLAFGSVLDGYSQVYHPLGLLGGMDIPNAVAFNLLGFVIPGVLALIAISALRTSLAPTAGWRVRIGVQLLVLSAIAFAVQGLVSIDPADLGAPGNRYHAVAWTLWWIAFVSGAFLLALSIWRYAQWRTLVWVSLGAALTVLTFALFAPDAIPSGIAERISFSAWFGWLLLVTRNSRPALQPWVIG